MASKLTRSITQPLTRPLTSAVTEGLGGASLSAFSAAKYAIQQDAADVNILVIGDSTGNATDEWVYLFGQWLATQYPTHSVSYRLWDDVGNVYGAAVALGTGTGANTIRIWNASVAGSRPSSLMGVKFASAVAAVTPDAIIFNHGKNISLFQVEPVIEGGFVGPVEQVMQAHPGVPVAMLAQSPNRDDDEMAMVKAALDKYRSIRSDLAIADAYSLFMAQGKAAALYLDNLHPSAAGTQLFLGAVQSTWRQAARGPFEAAASLLGTQAANLLTNGDFSAFAGVVPDGWSVLTSVTAEQDATLPDTGDAYSLKLTNSASAYGRISQNLSFAQRQELAGSTVSFAARVRSPAGSGTSNGIASVLIGAPSGNVIYDCLTDTDGKDGFRWCAIPAIPVPADVNAIQVRLSADSNATVGSYSNWSRAILVEGDIPRDML